MFVLQIDCDVTRLLGFLCNTFESSPHQFIKVLYDGEKTASNFDFFIGLQCVLVIQILVQ